MKLCALDWKQRASSRMVQRVPLLAAAAASVAGVSGFIVTPQAGAATSYTWTGATSAVWNLNTNWQGNLLPTSGNPLVFNNSPSSGLDLNNNLTTSSFNIAGISFVTGAGAFVIGDGTTNPNVGNPFTLTGSIVNTSGMLQTINDPFSIGSTQTISPEAGGVVLGGNITGAGGITETLSGVLTLNGTNAYAGLTTITAGILQLGSAGAIASGNALTTAAAGTLDLNGNSQTLGTVIHAGSITNSSSTPATLTLAGAASGAGSYSGAINIVVGNTGTTTAALGLVNVNGTITDSSTSTGATTVTTLGSNVSEIIQGSSSSNLTLTTVNLNASGTTLASTGSSLLTATTVTGTAALTVNANSTGNITVTNPNLSGTITNSGSGTGGATFTNVIGTGVTGVFQTSATSVLALNGANTFTGGLTITRGTVSSTAGANGGFGAGIIYLGNTAPTTTDNATLLDLGSNSIANPIIVQSPSTGVLAIEGQFNNNTFTSAITLNGAVTLADLTATTTTFSGVFNGSQPVGIGGNGITNTGTITLSGGSATTTTTYATGATSITLSSLPLGVGVGDLISGPNIPAGTTISSVSGTTLGLSAATTGASTNQGAVAFTALSGTVTLNSGLLLLNDALALGSGTFVIDGGALGGTTTLTAANPQTWNADFVFTPAATNNTLNMGTGNVSLGTVTLGAAAVAGARTVTGTNSGTLIVGGIVSNGTQSSNPVTTILKAGNGTLEFTNTGNTFSNLTVDGGVVTAAITPNVTSSSYTNITNGGTPLGTGAITLNSGGIGFYGYALNGGNTATFVSLNNAIVLAGNGSITMGDNSKRYGVLDGQISGAGQLTLTVPNGSANSGLVINASNSYTGGTNLDNPSTQGSGTYNSVFYAAATGAFGSGSLGAGGVVTFVNASNVVSQSSSELILLTSQAIGGLSSSTGSANGLGPDEVTGYSTSAANQVTLTIASDAGSPGDGASYSGAIGGVSIYGGPVLAQGASGYGTAQEGNNIALVKTGTGLQIISGISNTYAGGTTINGGNLQINNASGSALGTGSVTLGSADPSATLSGNGSTTGLVTVGRGGRIAPGSNGSSVAGATYANFGSAGSITLGSTGGLALTSANLDFDLATTAAGTSDEIVTGALSLTSVGVTFNGLGASVQTGTPYVLIHYTSTTAADASAFSSTNFVGTLASGGYTATYSLDTANDNVDVTLSSTPEPASLSLLAFGGLMTLMRRRRSPARSGD